jgi:drug/metabolite transporter (DMT)-like permease
VIDSAPSPAARAAQILPAVVAGLFFACADVMTKVALQDHTGVFTFAALRSMVGVSVLYALLRAGAPPVPLTGRARWLSAGLGVVFACNTFFLFSAIGAVDVPVAILTYFVYPLLTGLAAAALGIETLGLRGGLAAVVAFLGLGVMIGAHPGGVASAGIGFALMASCCQTTVLLVTRTNLAGSDPRLVSLCMLATTTAIFALVVLASWPLQPPQTPLGWSALVGSGAAAAVALRALLYSTTRIGAFRTALFMNLEPLLATIGSAVFLGELVTPLQALGGAVMIAALVAFQMRRREGRLTPSSPPSRSQ